MSAWDVIEEALASVQVSVKLGSVESFIVHEALAADLRAQLEFGSAWHAVEVLAEDVMAVQGLSPQEVEMVKKAGGQPAQEKRGNSGHVVTMDPNSWMRVKQQLLSQPEYYQVLAGGVADVEQLASKIQQAVSLQMGSKPAAQGGKPAWADLGGAPSDPTPSVQGRDKFALPPGVGMGYDFGGGQGIIPQQSGPFANKAGDDAAARRARVAAQDAAMMGKGGTKIGRVRVQDGFDPLGEDMTAEGIGRWARGAMAAGALGLSGGALGADQPASPFDDQASVQMGGIRPEHAPDTRTIDYARGFKPQPELGDEFDPSDPMGGLRPEKKPLAVGADERMPRGK